MGLVSHVVDLLIGGTTEDVQWVKESVEKKYDVKNTDIDNAKGGSKFLALCGVLTRSTRIPDEWRLANANPSRHASCG